jgi:addiction module HigA family antidote
MTIKRKDLDTGRVDLSDIIDPLIPALPPIPPGEILRAEWLEPLGITPYRLAKDTGVPPNRMGAICAGERAITADTALRLARYFGTDAQFGLKLQSRYDLEIAIRKSGCDFDPMIEPK